MEDNKLLTQRISWTKTLLISALVVFLFATISFVISRITNKDGSLLTKEIIYIIVIGISFLFSIACFIFNRLFVKKLKMVDQSGK